MRSQNIWLKSIKIKDFKNIEAQGFEFNQQFNLIYGPNGTGKTSLLDAIHLLCIGKSHFHTDRQSLRQGQDFFRVEGQFYRKEAPVQVHCTFPYKEKKRLVRDGQTYDKIRDHLGLLPLIILAPDDLDLITEGSLKRRQLLDVALSQAQSDYLQALVRYNQILEQRNASLKSNKIDHALIQTYEELLCPLAELIYQKRLGITQALGKDFAAFYQGLSGQNETVELHYQSQRQNAPWPQLFEQYRQQDIRRQFTQVGIHRDDLKLALHDSQLQLKTFASQGQRKTAFIALKLAQYQRLAQDLGIKPILLLDDVCDKLDPQRIKALIEMLGNEQVFGQVFFTHTQGQALQNLIEKQSSSLSILELPFKTS